MQKPNREHRSVRNQFRCSVCKNQFTPHVRTRKIQITCASRSCQLEHRAIHRRRYRAQNNSAEIHYQQKVKENRSANYWKNYRIKNKNSTNLNRLQTKLRKRLRKTGLQCQLDIFQIIENESTISRVQRFATSNQSEIDSLHCKDPTQED